MNHSTSALSQNETLARLAQLARRPAKGYILVINYTGDGILRVGAGYYYWEGAPEEWTAACSRGNGSCRLSRCSNEALYFFAEAAAVVAVAGDLGPITIESLGPHDLRLRRVRVTQVDSDGTVATWEGPLADWQGAVAEVATRPAFPGTIPDWTPGPYETAARSEAQAVADLLPTEQARVEYENLRLEALRDFDRADTSYEREQCQRRLDELIRAEEKRADDIADERARAADREADFDRRQREILAGEYAGTK